MPSKKIVVLTGSGISAESGLSTFRDSGGLWEGYDVHEVASIEGWNANPKKVLEFYNLRRTQAAKALPNEAHFYLNRLEKKFKVVIITQNVDDLHERAGSTDIIHLHGELRKACSELNSEEIVDIGNQNIRLGDLSKDGSQLRPAIVWFGEMVPMIEVATLEVKTADYLIVIGTSLEVYPAASLIHYAKDNIEKVIIDPSKPRMLPASEWRHIQKKATEGVPELVNEMLNNKEYEKN
ncbi:MAG: NAD-dependent deacylase [Balneolaceae bacterium]